MKQPNPHLAARRARKAALLPQVVQLAREGLSCQDIAEKVGLAKSTVCQWLRGQPLEQAATTLGTPRMTAKLARRYEALYQKAMREWNRSKTDQQIRTVETIAPADGGPMTKTTVRTEPRITNAACLGRALAAMKAMEGLHYREQQRLEIQAEFGRGPTASDRAADEGGDGDLPDEQSLTPTEEDTYRRKADEIIARLNATKATVEEQGRGLMEWYRATGNAHEPRPTKMRRQAPSATRTPRSP